MKNIKTPIIQPLRTQGGTFYTFASAVEDIGLNITNDSKNVKLSHYALLNIPMCDENIDDVSINKFNVFSMPGAVAFRVKNKNINVDPKINIAQSFLSYALNMENAIINKERYDYSEPLSISERVFWKWLKETGAIRWHKDDNGNILEGDKNDTTYNYNTVVKAIGRIDAVNQRIGDYGIYNEIFVNIPSSFGDMPIYFIDKSDNNYYHGMEIKTDDKIDNNISDSIFLVDSSLYNITFGDYVNSLNVESHITTDGVAGGWCNINNVLNTDSASSFYVVDNVNNSNDNNIVKISYDDVSYSYLRSKYDCICLDILLTNELYDSLTYDEIAKKGDNYNFNTILLYYSITDDNDKIIATNLYGVYFIDSPKYSMNENDTNDNLSNTLEFYLPSLNKVKSTINGFGTSYSFKINMRTSSIYDNTKAPIIDNSSSENSIVNDFNDVLSNLNKSVELLNKQVKHSEIISRKYDEMSEQVFDIQYKLNNNNNNNNSDEHDTKWIIV